MLDERVAQAFAMVAADDESPDRVVADPALNSKFIAKCRELGLAESVAEINRCLLNQRKSGDFTGMRTTRRVFRSPHPPSDFHTAVEIALRHLELTRGASLDAIICDPQLAEEFDAIVAQIRPGYSSFDYRWAALSLRKRSKVKPEHAARLLPPAIVEFGKVVDIEVNSLPNQQGIYILATDSQTLYIGEAQNLRKRLKKHFEHSDNRELARWFWEHGFGDVFLHLYVLPQATTTPQRRAFEQELIGSRDPVFNVRR